MQIILTPPLIKSYERPRYTQWGVYNSKEYKAYKELLTRQIKAKCDTHFADKPLSITMTFLFKLPKQLTKANRDYRLSIGGGVMITKDVDNLAKAVLDSMNGVVFNDDRQVISLTSTKLYTTDEAELILIDINTL